MRTRPLRLHVAKCAVPGALVEATTTLCGRVITCPEYVDKDQVSSEDVCTLCLKYRHFPSGTDGRYCRPAE